MVAGLMRKVVFDSDTASDDAIALQIATKRFDVVGVTIVAGNVEFERQVKNALFTLEYFGYDAPVFKGPNRPLLGLWKTVEEVHGPNGFGGWSYPEPSKKAEQEYAPDAIVRLSKEYSGELEMLAVSPLTNLALAYLKDPCIVERISKVWIMGGALSRGNTTRIAEYNFWVDPEAAKIVLGAGFDVTIVPWETAEETAVVTEQEWKELESRGTKAADFFVKTNKALLAFSLSQGVGGSVQPDSFTAAIAADNSLILKTRNLNVDVETCSEARGAMLVDYYGSSGKKENASLIFKADQDGFKKVLLEEILA
jgi:purine nucleosidase